MDGERATVLIVKTQALCAFQGEVIKTFEVEIFGGEEMKLEFHLVLKEFKRCNKSANKVLKRFLFGVKRVMV